MSFRRTSDGIVRWLRRNLLHQTYRQVYPLRRFEQVVMGSARYEEKSFEPYVPNNH